MDAQQQADQQALAEMLNAKIQALTLAAERGEDMQAHTQQLLSEFNVTEESLQQDMQGAVQMLQNPNDADMALIRAEFAKAGVDEVAFEKTTQALQGAMEKGGNLTDGTLFDDVTRTMVADEDLKRRLASINPDQLREHLTKEGAGFLTPEAAAALNRAMDPGMKREVAQVRQQRRKAQKPLTGRQRRARRHPDAAKQTE